MENSPTHPSNNQPLSPNLSANLHLPLPKFTRPTPLLIFISLLAFILLYAYSTPSRIQDNSATQTHTTITTTPIPPTLTPPIPTPTLDLHQHWQTYSNDDLGIQFQYPDGWIVGERFEHEYLPGTVNDILIYEKNNQSGGKPQPIPYVSNRIEVLLFSYKLDIEAYVRHIYKDDTTASIYKGILSTSPYITTEYVLNERYQ